MNEYQQRLIAEAKMKEEMQNTSEESLMEARLRRIDELQLNPGDANFAMLSGSVQLGAYRGRLDSVRWFISKNKALPDDLDTKGYAAIHYAAEQGHELIIKYLLSVGSDVNLPSESGMTPLMAAAKGGKASTLRLLWEEGAWLSCRDAAAQTAAHYAAQEDHADCLREMRDLAVEQIQTREEAALAEASALAADGLTAKPQLTETEGEEGELEEKPFTLKDIIDASSKSGATPLHVAAAFDSQQAIVALLNFGADVNARDSVMETPLHKAARRNFFQAYTLLKEAGGDDSARSMMHETPAGLLLDITSG